MNRRVFLRRVRAWASVLVWGLGGLTSAWAGSNDVVHPSRTGATGAGSFFFVLLADPQLGCCTTNAGFEKESAAFAQAVERINRWKPSFVAICGDFINAPPEQPVGAAQIAEFKRLLKLVDPAIPVKLVPGNHEIRTASMSTDLERYRKEFGPDYYSFDHGGWHFLALDSPLLTAPEQAPEEGRRQAEWLRNDLKDAQARRMRTIVFLHHPWFLFTPEEPEAYFNVPLKARKDWLPELQSHSVAATFSGHLHNNGVQVYEGMQMVITGPVCNPLGPGGQAGLRMVRVYPDRLEHRFYPMDRLPAEVPAWWGDSGKAALKLPGEQPTGSFGGRGFVRAVVEGMIYVRRSRRGA